MTPIPIEPPIGGVLWSVVVPAALFLVTFLATYLLYRHFAGKVGKRSSDAEGDR